MSSPCCPNPVPVVHRQRSPKSQGFFKDDGCEVAPACLGWPLSGCKYDDPDWYRFWRKHGRFPAIGEATHRERLTTEQAARLFRVGTRTVQRAILFRRKAARLLTPDDLDVFIMLAEAGDHSDADLRQVA